MEAHLYEAHERLEDTHWWFEGRRRLIEKVMAANLRTREGRRILDVGCGTGGMFPLLQRFGSVDGAEYSADARERAARRFPSATISACALPNELPAGTWDVVTAFDVIEHVDDPEGSLATMRARLAPDGQVVVTVPAFQFLWSRHDEVNQHKRRYTRHLLEGQLVRAGFRVQFCSYFNSILFPAVAGVRAAQRLFKALDRGDGSDLDELNPVLNAALTTLFSLESKVVPGRPLPFGVSLIAVAERA
jgi:SAM-dependent methyltransferase